MALLLLPGDLQSVYLLQQYVVAAIEVVDGGAASTLDGYLKEQPER